MSVVGPPSAGKQSVLVAFSDQPTVSLGDERRITVVVDDDTLQDIVYTGALIDQIV